MNGIITFFLRGPAARPCVRPECGLAGIFQLTDNLQWICPNCRVHRTVRTGCLQKSHQEWSRSRYDQLLHMIKITRCNMNSFFIKSTQVLRCTQQFVINTPSTLYKCYYYNITKTTERELYNTDNNHSVTQQHHLCVVPSAFLCWLSLAWNRLGAIRRRDPTTTASVYYYLYGMCKVCVFRREFRRKQDIRSSGCFLSVPLAVCLECCSYLSPYLFALAVFFCRQCIQ